MTFKDIKRMKNRYENLTILGFVMIIGGFLFIMPMSRSGEGLMFIMIIIFALGGFVTVYAAQQFKKISMIYKKQYLSNIIKEVYPGSTFQPELGFNQDEIYASKLLRKADRYYSEDLITGQYQDITFRSADIRLQEWRSTGKSATLVTVFLGRVYQFSFPEAFPTNMVIMKHQIGSGFGFNQYHKIKTESVEFHEEFDVYAKNELKSFEMLTPPIMERLIEMNRKYYEKIRFSFVKNDLYISIDNRVDTLDIKLFQTLKEDMSLQFSHQLEEMKVILDMLDYRKNKI